MESQRLLADAALDDFFHAYESSAADEQDIRGVHRRKFLVRMLASTLGWNIGNGAFQDLQQRLLHALTRNVPGNGGILVFLGNLIDLVDIDDALLSAGDVPIGGLQQLQNNVFHVFADVAGFGKRGSVDDCEGHIEHARKSLSQKGLASAGGTDQQNIGFREFHIAGLFVQEDALVVIVNGDGKLLFRFVLADYVAIEKGFDLGRAGQASINRTSLLALFVFQNLLADAHALVADVGPRILRGRADKLLHLLLRFMAEGTSQRLFWGEPLHKFCPRLLEATTVTTNLSLIVRRRAGRLQRIIALDTNPLEPTNGASK